MLRISQIEERKVIESMRGLFRKISVLFASIVIGISLTGCSRKDMTPTTLVNRMTGEELNRVSMHEFTLTETDMPLTHKVTLLKWTLDDLLAMQEQCRDMYPSEEAYLQTVEYYNSLKEEDPDWYSWYGALVDGSLVMMESMPDLDMPEAPITLYDENGEEIIYRNYAEYLEAEKEGNRKQGKIEYGKSLYNQEMLVYEAILSGNYDIAFYGDVSENPNVNFRYVGDYRSSWEYDKEEVERITDNIREISIYDEEMAVDFLVHVVLPPNYDAQKTCPVFFLTDGVWRFGDVVSMRKQMEKGKADPAIIVTLGYEHEDGTSDGVRFRDLIQNRALLCDFITDNLMPYLCEQFNIDCEASTLYGHSNGGVFAHYALCNSDLYENKPFTNYIIGSPAFWAVNGAVKDEMLDGSEVEAMVNDYGYFDRNKKMDRNVFLCGGTLEDEDYRTSYRGFDTTLEGIEKLKNRLEEHHVNITYKLYESHHYQYIPEMLEERLEAGNYRVVLKERI